MPRNLTQDQINAIKKQELKTRILVTIDLEDGPLRLLENDTLQVLTIDGKEYIAGMVERSEIETSMGGTVEKVNIKISNVWQDISGLIANEGDTLTNRKCTIEEVIFDESDIGESVISSQGFVTNGLMGFWHAGNYDGQGNYIKNDPFPTSMVDLTDNGYDLALSNFAGTTSSGANGSNTTGDPAYIRMDGVDDSHQAPASLRGSNLPSEGCITMACNIHTMVQYKYWIDSFLGSNRLIFRILTFFENDKADYGYDSSTNDYEINRVDIDLNQNLLLTLNYKTYQSQNGYVDLYINNQFIGRKEVTDPNWTVENTQVLCNLPCNFHYQGIYNRNLSLQEVVQNYNVGLVWNKNSGGIIDDPILLFEGCINSIQLTAESFTFDVERVLGGYSTESPNTSYDVNCQWKFKDERCQYSGTEQACDKTWGSCRIKERFGGYPSIPKEMVISAK